MSNVLIIGGHGKVALLLAPELVSAGHQVTSVIRNPDQASDVAATGAHSQVADVETLDTATLSELFTGQDVIVWSAGAGGGNPQRTRAVDQDAAIRSMTAAENSGARRYLMVSYFNSGTDAIPTDDPFYAYAQAKARADDHLRATDLDWTVLGPSSLTTEDATGRISVDGTSTSVSRGNVALVAAAAIADPATIKQTIRFNDGEQPIAEAFGALTR